MIAPDAALVSVDADRLPPAVLTKMTPELLSWLSTARVDCTSSTPALRSANAPALPVTCTSDGASMLATSVKAGTPTLHRAASPQSPSVTPCQTSLNAT